MSVTCSEHRETLVLLAIKRRLAEEDLSDEERIRLSLEAAELEDRLKMT